MRLITIHSLYVWLYIPGIRHSVGGTDYSTVRAGAFMGLRILNHAAQQQHQQHIGVCSSTKMYLTMFKSNAILCLESFSTVHLTRCCQWVQCNIQEPFSGGTH